LLDLSLALAPALAGIVIVIAFETAAGFLLIFAAIIVGFFLPAWESSRPGEANGRTFGKRRAGVRVVREDGRPITLGFALLRETVVKAALYIWAGALFLFIPAILDSLWPLWDDESRALHDMAVRTRVVRS
jgi:uncharacterized RDD family membrane protein YckC